VEGQNDEYSAVERETEREKTREREREKETAGGDEGKKRGKKGHPLKSKWHEYIQKKLSFSFFDHD
jgi:hypothetical protein